MTSMTKTQRKAYTDAGAEKIDAFNIDPNNVWIIGLDTEDGEDHPLYDNRINTKLDKDFVNNIAAHGVKKPIIVRAVKMGDETVIVCVDGRQRVRALREANKKRSKNGAGGGLSVPAKHETGKADDDATVSMVTANSYHLADGPYEQAVKAAKLKNAGMKDSDVAVALSMSTATLRNRLKLLDLPSDVAKSIDKIGPMAALTIGKIEDDAERKEALDEAKSQTSKYGSNAKAKKKAKKAKAKKNGGEEALERPSISTIRKVCATDAFENVHPMAKKAFMFFLGEIGASSIKGLSKCLAELESED